MFFTMDITSLKTIKSQEVLQESHFIPSETVSTKNIVDGPSKRSRNGCQQCRQRKKKCDETFPTCGPCQHRGVQCTPRSKNKLTIKKHRFSNAISQTSTSIPQVRQTTTIVAPSQVIYPTIQQGSLSTDADLYYSRNVYAGYFKLSPLAEPSSSLSCELDSSALFLQGFVSKVAKIICIATDATNYYCKTFVQVAASDQATLYALSAWGGLFIEGYTPSVQSYLRKSIELSRKRTPNYANATKLEIYVMLSYFIIMMGFNISVGDVNNWHFFLQQAIKLMHAKGGMNRICQMFESSNDIKFIISTISFHDIMSSRSFADGPSFALDEYDCVFKSNKILEVGDYGLDPLQGCIQPIYLLLAEITSVAVELKNKKKILDQKFATVSKSTQEFSAMFDSNEQEFDLKLSRIEFYEEVTAKYAMLQDKLQECLPNTSQMGLILDDNKEVELHLTLFEVYSYTCQLCMLLQIKETPPVTFEMQNILVNALNCVDVLVDTKMVASLAFALLICGISCCTSCDRKEMERRLEKIKKIYPVDNISRIQDIIREVWRLNNNGTVYIDWVDLCVKRNWALSVI